MIISLHPEILIRTDETKLLVSIMFISIPKLILNNSGVVVVNYTAYLSYTLADFKQIHIFI